MWMIIQAKQNLKMLTSNQDIDLYYFLENHNYFQAKNLP